MKVLKVSEVKPELLALFDELNQIHFGGILRQIPIRQAGAQVGGAMFYPEWEGRKYDRATRKVVDDSHPTHIMLTPRSNDLDLRATLLHEMVHYYLWFKFARKPRSMKTDHKAYARFANGHGDNYINVLARCHREDPVFKVTPHVDHYLKPKVKAPVSEESQVSIVSK